MCSFLYTFIPFNKPEDTILRKLFENKRILYVYIYKIRLFTNNLMFIRFPAILLVKTIDSYHMNFVHGLFYIAIFSNMAQRQRARYRVARYVIVELRHCKQRHNSNAWIKDEERMKTSLTEKKWKQFEQLLFGRFEFFQRWQLEVE